MDPARNVFGERLESCSDDPKTGFFRDGCCNTSDEDIGRHNAVDKVIGRALRTGRLPLEATMLAVSGRLGFEIVQKAAVAGVPLLARGHGEPERQGETMMNIDESRHLSAAEAAKWLGISARSLYRMREDGKGPEHYLFGYRILYRMEALERWAAENLVKPPPDDGPGRRAT